MKLILKYISIFTIALLAFGCGDFDDNGSMPDNMMEASFPYIVFDADASSPFINLSAPEEYSFSGTIDVLFSEVPFANLRLVVAYNGAYDKPYTISDNITSVPYDFTVTSDNLIAAIDELGSYSDIKTDDKYHVYVIPTVDGEELPPYQILGGKTYNTVSSSIIQNLTAFTGLTSADVMVNVPCELLPELMVGSYYMASDDWGAWGDVTIEADPNDPFKVFIYGIAAAEGLVDNGNGLEINIDPNTYAASGVETILAADVAPWGLPYVDYFYSPVSVTYNTCDGSYSMITYIGISIGGWGNFNYTFTRND